MRHSNKNNKPARFIRMHRCLLCPHSISDLNILTSCPTGPARDSSERNRRGDHRKLKPTHHKQSVSSLNDTRRRPIFKRARLQSSGTEIRDEAKRGFSSRRVAVSTSLDTNQRLNIVAESGIAWRKTSQLPGWHEGCNETEENSFHLHQELKKWMNESLQS